MTAQPAWQTQLDPVLVNRLAQPLHSPGLVRSDLAETIQGRLQQTPLSSNAIAQRLLQRRRSTASLPGGARPLVYGQRLAPGSPSVFPALSSPPSSSTENAAPDSVTPTPPTPALRVKAQPSPSLQRKPLPSTPLPPADRHLQRVTPALTSSPPALGVSTHGDSAPPSSPQISIFRAESFAPDRPLPLPKAPVPDRIQSQGVSRPTPSSLPSHGQTPRQHLPTPPQRPVVREIAASLPRSPQARDVPAPQPLVVRETTPAPVVHAQTWPRPAAIVTRKITPGPPAPPSMGPPEAQTVRPEPAPKALAPAAMPTAEEVADRALRQMARRLTLEQERRGGQPWF